MSNNPENHATRGEAAEMPPEYRDKVFAAAEAIRYEIADELDILQQSKPSARSFNHVHLEDLGIKSNSPEQVAELKKFSGDVAHEVIDQLKHFDITATPITREVHGPEQSEDETPGYWETCLILTW